MAFTGMELMFTWFTVFLELISVFHLLSLFFLFNIISIPAFLLLLWSRWYYLAIIYAAWYCFDYMTPFRGGRRFEFLRRSFVWTYLVKYFPIVLHKTVDLDPTKNYMFCFHPHGAFGISALANFASEATGFSKSFPGITIHGLSLDINFRLPFFREYFMALGLGAVRKDSIHYKLTKLGEGHSVGIVPGGASEAEICDPNNPYRLKLKERRGFIREALKAGATLLPVFSFGESEHYYVTKPEAGSFMYYFQNFTHRHFRFVPIKFHGRFGLLPLRKPINTVAGGPIDLPKLENPTEEEVKMWHGKYVAALTELFESHKAKFGTQGMKLELV